MKKPSERIEEKVNEWKESFYSVTSCEEHSLYIDAIIQYLDEEYDTNRLTGEKKV